MDGTVSTEKISWLSQIPASREPNPALGPDESSSKHAEASPPENPRKTPFARLVPINAAARTAFHELVIASKNGKIAPHNKQFINLGEDDVATAPVAVADDNVTTSDSEAGLYSHSEPDSESSLIQGSFSFFFQAESSRLSGWRIGKGSSKFADRNVDILVIPPPEARTSASSRRAAKSILSNHSIINLRQESGVFRLACLSSSKPIKYQFGSEVKLLSLEGHVLSQMQNYFWVGDLSYCFEYLVKPEEYEEYIRERNAVLLEHQPGISVPHTMISGVPREGDRVVGEALVHRSINTGAFGVVLAGVHMVSGKPLAIKEMCIKNRRCLPAVQNEAEVAKRFKEARTGLLQTTAIYYEHGGSKASGTYPERVYLVSPLALSDFSKFSWSNCPMSTRLELFFDVLQGLKNLHDSGYMHRDISPKNLLVVSLSPPEAVICDFGKATSDSHSSDTHIGPIVFLAPEVKSGSTYDKRIDIWNLGYSFYLTMFTGRTSMRVDKGHHKEIVRNLDNMGKRGGTHLELSILMNDMLAWDPDDRIKMPEIFQTAFVRQMIANRDERKNEENEKPRKKARV